MERLLGLLVVVIWIAATIGLYPLVKGLPEGIDALVAILLSFGVVGTLVWIQKHAAAVATKRSATETLNTLERVKRLLVNHTRTKKVPVDTSVMLLRAAEILGEHSGRLRRQLQSRW